MERFVPRTHSNQMLQLSWYAFPLLCLSIAGIVWREIPESVTQFSSGTVTSSVLGVSLQQQQLLLSLVVFVGPLYWAYMVANRARRKYRDEFRQLKRARDLSKQHRKQIREVDGRLRVDVPVSELSAEHYLLPGAGAAGAELSSARMIQQLFTNAREMRRDSDLTSQVFLRELGPARMSLRVPQHIALRLGIFFTFIGLLVGLEPIAGAFRENGDQSLAIGQLISGLTLAFGTSVAGLGASMLIQLLIAVVDRDYTIVTRLLESVWMDLGHTLSYARFEGDLPRNVDRLTQQIAEHRDTVETYTRNVNASVDRVIEGYEEQAGRIAKAIEKFGSSLSAVEALDQRYQQQIEHLDQLARGLQEYQANWSGTLHSNLRSTLEAERTHFTNLQQEVTDSLASLHKRFKEQFEKNLEADRARYDNLNQDVTDSLHRIGDSIVKRVDGLESDERALAATIEQLRRSLESNNQRIESTVSLVDGISERLNSQQKQQWQRVEEALVKQADIVGTAVTQLGQSVETLAAATREYPEPCQVEPTPTPSRASGVKMAGSVFVGLLGGLLLTAVFLMAWEPAYIGISELRGYIGAYLFREET